MAVPISDRSPRSQANKLLDEDRPVHDWYRFVLSFPPHLVRQYIERFDLQRTSRVLDPFCGTGTTLVECKKLSVPSVGVEANPMAHFASAVKLDWEPDCGALAASAERIADDVSAALSADGHGAAAESLPGPVGTRRSSTGARKLRSLSTEQAGLLLSDSISSLPLHKTLILLEQIDRQAEPRLAAHLRLGLAKALVFSISNLHFGPEVGVGPAKHDPPVVAAWRGEVRQMAEDLRSLRDSRCVQAAVHRADSRGLANVIEPNSIDAVITSPPYPNEKDYTRTTRLESVLLGFLHNKADLRALKQGLIRSNTRNVYKHDDDQRWVEQHPEIQRIAAAIEARRIELGKTSGFERLYGRVTKLYFGGMARHLADLRQVLRPGAQLAYVVGDQASYLRIMIRTGQLLGDIARSLGYELVGIDLFRTRLATATREQLREEVLLLRWPGK